MQALYDHHLKQTGDESKLLDKLRYFHEINSTIAKNKIKKTEQKLGIVRSK